MNLTNNGITPNADVKAIRDTAGHQVIWTTGEIAEHVTGGNTVSFKTPVLSPSGTAILEFKYGLWDSPNVTFSVSLNGQELGTVNAVDGYINPGPQFVDWWPIDISGNENTIEIKALPSNGEAVIGSLSIIAG